MSHVSKHPMCDTNSESNLDTLFYTIYDSGSRSPMMVKF